MQLVVMRVAHRNRELIRDLHRHRPRLREAQVMRLRRPPPADQARLAGDKGEMRRISDPLFFWNEVRARRLARRQTLRRLSRHWMWTLRLPDLARAFLQGLGKFSC